MSPIAQQPNARCGSSRGLVQCLCALLLCGVRGNLIAQAPEEANVVRTQITTRVDELLAGGWRAASVSPGAGADDAEFLRRVSLDLTGVIPRVADAREFLSDTRPDKRELLVEQLLRSPMHAAHLANAWRRMLLPGELSDQQAAGAAGFQAWLREQFAANLRYDNLVAELLVTKGGAEQTGPALFYTSLELKPEEVAANTSRIFLGVQIECAQCHDHPFDRWTKQDFWGYAAFFARLESKPGRQASMLQLVDAPTGELKYPETDLVVLPKYLDASAANENEDSSRRRQLAIWLVSRDNPFFAKAAVNRVWAQMFGRGLTEPVDDFSERNPPSHPELLNELADYFIETGFDLRSLYAALANTQAYQLSSQSDHVDERAPELFAGMAIKSLTPEQLYDSLLQATQQRQRISVTSMGPADPRRAEFLARFESPGQAASEFEAGIPQALAMMNGPLVATATQPDQGWLLTALEAPLLSDDDRVETLFLATLSRLPSQDEKTAIAPYLAAAETSADRQRALGDILWSLLNSAEFMLNH